MEELQVVAQQTPGTISWNFEELKERLSAEMKRYEEIEYTDENIKEEKSDIAGLRKLQKEVNDRKIEIKKTWLLPYDAFEAQVNELKAIIEKPIAMIDEKVKDYEARRKKPLWKESGHISTRRRRSCRRQSGKRLSEKSIRINGSTPRQR